MSHRHFTAPAALCALYALLMLGGAAPSPAQTEATLIESAPSVPSAAAQEAPRKRLNVLENGDFEALDEMLAPAGWNSTRNASFAFVEDEEGNHFVQIKARGDDAARRIFRRLVLGPTWKTLRVTARLKAEGLQVGDKPWRDGHIVVTFYNRKNEPLKFTRPIALTSGSEWKFVAGHETIPPESSHCEIEIANYAASGTFSVDDVAVEPDGLVEAPLLRPGFPEGRFDTFEPGPVGDAAKQPVGWPIAGLPGLSLEQEGANHFLRFSNGDPKGHVRMETIWRLQPNTRALKVSARMRARELQMGKEPWQTARVGLAFTDALGVDAPEWPPALQLRADSDWRTVSQSFAVPEDARFLKIMPELMQARGVLDVDDILVEQVP